MSNNDVYNQLEASGNIINGVKLTPRQELTLSFILFLAREELKDVNSLGSDATGISIRKSYLMGINEISNILNEFRVDSRYNIEE